MKNNRLFPGFYLSLGYTCFALLLVVIVPLATLAYKSIQLSWGDIWSVISEPRTLAAFRLSFGTAFVSAALNSVFGFMIAWILVRYDFVGKRIIDSLIDLPFALPTAVAGVTLTALYAPNGWIGQHLSVLGIQVAYTPLGIVLALMFVGLPFVVRSVEPVLKDMEPEIEEAASSLGANRKQIFFRIIFPSVCPALLTGFTLAFARGIGEYGSVVFISGNMPMRTEIAPLLIMSKLEQFDYAGATVIAMTLLIISFALLLAINTFQGHTSKKLGMEA